MFWSKVQCVATENLLEKWRKLQWFFYIGEKNTKKFSRGVHICNLEEDGRIKLVITCDRLL
jgi:hypothetical protein